MSNGQLSTLLAICPDAQVLEEAGLRFVSLPKLKVEVGNEVKVLDALLSVTQHSGYTTRLFLSEQIAGRSTICGNAANWSTHQILGRNWWTWSWQGVPGDIPWSQILVAHLRALK